MQHYLLSLKNRLAAVQILTHFQELDN